jgi:hypothetical protein
MKQIAGNNDVQRFILERLDQIEAKMLKPAPSYAQRRKASSWSVEATVSGERPSVDEFSTSLLHYRICDALQHVSGENGSVRIIFEPLREKESIESDLRAIVAKYPKVKLDSVVVR